MLESGHERWPRLRAMGATREAAWASVELYLTLVRHGPHTQERGEVALEANGGDGGLAKFRTTPVMSTEQEGRANAVALTTVVGSPVRFVEGERLIVFSRMLSPPWGFVAELQRAAYLSR
jgi:hypothetical protein